MDTGPVGRYGVGATTPTPLESRMKRTHLLSIGIAIFAVMLWNLIAADARPNRYGHSDREERHLFPAVSTGPARPGLEPRRPVDRLLDAG
jgi:hypothetical protein